MGRGLITLITPKTFCNHIIITRNFVSKLKFRSWKFLFGVYVIFMEFFEVNKSLQCIVQGIRHVILHQINEFWWARTHTWKNSSIFWMMKMSNFAKSDIFIICLNESMDESFMIMQNILNTYNNTIRSKLKYFCHIESHSKSLQFQISSNFWIYNDFQCDRSTSILIWWYYLRYSKCFAWYKEIIKITLKYEFL